VIIGDYDNEKQKVIEKEIIENERKVAVVTGSSIGIGYSTALQLASYCYSH